jgi:hypothetical protein
MPTQEASELAGRELGRDRRASPQLGVVTGPTEHAARHVAAGDPDLDLELFEDSKVFVDSYGSDLHHFVPPWIEAGGLQVEEHERHAASCSDSLP